MTLPTPEQLKELGFRVNPNNECWMRDFPQERIGDTISQGYLQLVENPDEEGWTVEIHNGSRHLDTGFENLESACLPQRIHSHAQLVRIVRAVFDLPWENDARLQQMADLTVSRLNMMFDRLERRTRELELAASTHGRQIAAATTVLDALRKTFESVNTFEGDAAERVSIHLLNMIEKASTGLCVLIGTAAGYPSVPAILQAARCAPEVPSETEPATETA